MTPASFCPNCGAGQPAGAVFCGTCGSPQPVHAQAAAAVAPSPSVVAAPTPAVPGAAAVAAAPPPPPAPAAPPAPVGPTTAPLVGSAAAPSAPRLPMPQLIGIVVGVSLGVGALAVAITLALSGGDRPPGDDGLVTGDLQVVEVENIRVEVPATWDVVTRARDTIAVEDPSNRAMWLRSAILPTELSLDAIQERFLDRARDQSPDAKVCAGPETAALPGGPTDGRYFVICSTYIPQGGGPAVRLADAYYLGLFGGGLTVSMMQLTAVPESLEAFATEVRRLPLPEWKLHR